LETQLHTCFSALFLLLPEGRVGWEDTMKTLGFAALCFFVLFALPTAANADSFELTGPGLTITFSLPGTVTNPGIVTSVFSGDGTISGLSGFLIDNVLIMLNGSPTLENIKFFTDGTGGTAQNFGGLAIGSFIPGSTDLVNLLGPQLFSINNLADPFSATFTPLVSSSLTVCPSPSLCEFTPTVNSDLTLTITSPTAIPEPSSMLLFGTGLLGLGGLVRRKLRS
jgi:PEP-CTERM motif-containing protein